jgi:mRNA interferase RelE/StbE
MSWRVELSRRAEKSADSLPENIKKRILSKAFGLAADPHPPGCIKLSGREAWRIRVGDFRIVYEIRDKVLLVLVIEIGHRREVYR